MNLGGSKVFSNFTVPGNQSEVIQNQMNNEIFIFLRLFLDFLKTINLHLIEISKAICSLDAFHLSDNRIRFLI